MFSLVKNEELNNNGIKSVKVYESDYYTFRILFYDNGFTIQEIKVNIEGKSNCYIPRVYFEEDEDNLVIDVKIETYGCGSMNSEEIQNVIRGYQIAVEEIKELKVILKENNLYKEN